MFLGIKIVTAGESQALILHSSAVVSQVSGTARASSQLSSSLHHLRHERVARCLVVS